MISVCKHAIVKTVSVKHVKIKNINTQTALIT